MAYYLTACVTVLFYCATLTNTKIQIRPNFAHNDWAIARIEQNAFARREHPNSFQIPKNTYENDIRQCVRHRKIGGSSQTIQKHTQCSDLENEAIHKSSTRTQIGVIRWGGLNYITTTYPASSRARHFASEKSGDLEETRRNNRSRCNLRPCFS